MEAYLFYWLLSASICDEWENTMTFHFISFIPYVQTDIILYSLLDTAFTGI